MGLIKRLQQITAARIEAFLERIEEPDLIFPRLVVELEAKVRLAAAAEAKAITATRAAQRRMDEMIGRLTRLERGAAMALRKGDETTAREALSAQVESEQSLERCQEELARAESALEQARQVRQQLEFDLCHLRERQGEILDRARLAKRWKKIQIISQGASKSGESLLDQMSRLERRLDRDESLVRLGHEQRSVHGEAGLEKRLKALERNAEIEKRLANLKKPS